MQTIPGSRSIISRYQRTTHPPTSMSQTSKKTSVRGIENVIQVLGQVTSYTGSHLDREERTDRDRQLERAMHRIGLLTDR